MIAPEQDVRKLRISAVSETVACWQPPSAEPPQHGVVEGIGCGWQAPQT
jgi:hypothetical protein